MKRENSRKSTPWEGKEKLTPTQEFVKENYDTFYAERHRKISESGEADMINPYIPAKCPLCKTKNIRKADTPKAEFSVICAAYATKHFCPQQARFLTTTKFQSVNGRNIA
jgi:hypothetical protein